MGREIHHCPGCEAEIFDDMERCGRAACQPEALAAAREAVAGAREAQITALWATVRREIGYRDDQDMRRLEERFRAGAAEHGDDWTGWSIDRFREEIQQEHDDIVLYSAMLFAALRMRGAP